MQPRAASLADTALLQRPRRLLYHIAVSSLSSSFLVQPCHQYDICISQYHESLTPFEQYLVTKPIRYALELYQTKRMQWTYPEPSMTRQSPRDEVKDYAKG